MNLSFSAYRDTLKKLRYRSPLDTEYCDLIDRLTDLLTDYYDNNDTIENNGAEAAEYELAGMEPLPRNSPIWWREELLFIPEIRQLFPLDSDGRLTAVSLVSLPYNGNALPSIFTATPEILKMMKWSLYIRQSRIIKIMEAVLPISWMQIFYPKFAAIFSALPSLPTANISVS